MSFRSNRRKLSPLRQFPDASQSDRRGGVWANDYTPRLHRVYGNPETFQRLCADSGNTPRNSRSRRESFEGTRLISLPRSHWVGSQRPEAVAELTREGSNLCLYQKA